MLYCKSCGVSVRGDKERCPLCQQELSGTPDKESEVFPHIQLKKYNKHFLVKLVTFISITAIVGGIAVNMSFPSENEFKWSLFIIAGVFCAWLSAVTAIVKRRNILKSINWELFLITAFAVLWDVSTGWRGWSIDFVIPFSCMASMTCMYVLSKILKIEPRGFVMYMLFDVIYGIIPVIFIATGILHITYPSIACVAYSIISISAIILFQGKNIREEASRKFHI